MLVFTAASDLQLACIVLGERGLREVQVPSADGEREQGVQL